MKSLQGQLLVASPDLMDPNFLRTVLLMIQHNDDGALGLVLNRPTTTTIKQAWEQVSDTPCLRDEPLHLGGPCQGSLMVLHSFDSLMEIEVASELYFSAESSHVEELVRLEFDPIRYFVGFAGWSAGQLEAELETGSWRIAPATLDLVFYDDLDLWEEVMKQIATSTLLSALQIKHVPQDPSMN